MNVLPEQVQALFGTKRFYVLFADGSWRTATEEQWKSEQLWKLHPVRTWWAGGEDEMRAIQLVYARYLDDKVTKTSEAA